MSSLLIEGKKLSLKFRSGSGFTLILNFTKKKTFIFEVKKKRWPFSMVFYFIHKGIKPKFKSPGLTKKIPTTDITRNELYILGFFQRYLVKQHHLFIYKNLSSGWPSDFLFFIIIRQCISTTINQPSQFVCFSQGHRFSNFTSKAYWSKV